MKRQAILRRLRELNAMLAALNAFRQRIGGGHCLGARAGGERGSSRVQRQGMR